MGPLVSIVTVCYNAKDVIEKTILSVLNQTYSNLEYIIIDGGSSDGTMDIVQQYANRISYVVSEPDKGIYDAMNKGTNSSKGDWILFLNAGDTFYSDNTVDFFFKEKVNAGVLYGNVKVVETFGSYILQAGSANELDKGEIPFCHQSVFIQSELMKNHPYDLKYRICADYNLFYHLWKEGEIFYHINETVAIYDVSQGSFALSHYRKAKREELQIIGKDSGINRLYFWFFLLKSDMKRFLTKLELKKSREKRIKKSLSQSPRVIWHSWD